MTCVPVAALFAINATTAVAKPIVLGAWWGCLMAAAATEHRDLHRRAPRIVDHVAVASDAVHAIDLDHL
jgi:hypothetical protein